MDTEAPKRASLRGDVKRVQVYLPSQLHRELKSKAALLDMSGSALVQRYVEEGLLRDGGRPRG